MQILADAGMCGIDGLTPSGGVALVNQLCNRNFGEVGIAEELGAVVERAAESFGGEMDCLGGTVPGLGQVVAFENVENFEKRDPARRRRRRADDVVVAIGSADDLAFLDFVLRQVLEGDEASTLLNGGRQLTSHGPVIELVGIFRDALERAGQFWLAKHLSLFEVIAVALKNSL